MKRFISLLLVIVSLCSFSVSGWTITEIDWDDVVITVEKEDAKKVIESDITFSDVPVNHWAYEDIMLMAKEGIINGTTKPVNGVGLFNPNGALTRAQFIVLLSRACKLSDLESDVELQNKYQDATWYFLDVARCVNVGILKSFNELCDIDKLNEPINREEMSFLMARVMGYKGEDLSTTMKVEDIPDGLTINSNYLDSVLICYSKGIIAGTDKAGTFHPKGTLNRAQGATVLNRLLNIEYRNPIK